MFSARAQWCVLSAALAVVSGASVVACAQDDSPAQNASQPGTKNTPHQDGIQPIPREAFKGLRAEVRAVTVGSDQFGPVIEITATRTLTPLIQTVQNPLRLVIDLPNSNLSTQKRRIPFRNQEIKSIRLNQFQAEPPVARVVVDLLGPVRYTWDALGTQLRIRIRPDQGATAKPPSVPALTAGTQPPAVPVAVGSSGSLVETGSRVASGSSITAGAETAVMRLTRGGEVRVCPGTTVSFTTSSNGNDLMLGMSRGSIETNYVSQDSVDSVLTPDFRIVLPGPGQFNVAISADARGNTCVGSLPGSTSSAVVAELIGSGTYEIKPEQQALFRQGRLDSVEMPLASCGCPAAQEPVLRTEIDSKPVVPDTQAGQKLQLAGPSSEEGSPSASPPSSEAGKDEGKAAESEADAPLVFSGMERAKAGPKAPPPPVDEAAALHLTVKPPEPPPAVVVLPPEPDPKASKKGFLGKMKGFFGSIFGK